MEQTVCSTLTEYNNNSPYSIDVLFYEKDGEQIAQLFNRFAENGTYDKFISVLSEDEVTENAVITTAEEVIDSAESYGYGPTDEFKTSGELS